MASRRTIRVMAYEVEANDVIYHAFPDENPTRHTVYEKWYAPRSEVTRASKDPEAVCLNLEGRRAFFDPGEQVVLDVQDSFGNLGVAYA